jgi:hypothetical protein
MDLQLNTTVFGNGFSTLWSSLGSHLEGLSKTPCREIGSHEAPCGLGESSFLRFSTRVQKGRLAQIPDWRVL